MKSGCPVVLLDNTFPKSPYDSIMADDLGGAYQATQHLIELGHRQILVFTGTIQHPTIYSEFQTPLLGILRGLYRSGE